VQAGFPARLPAFSANLQELAVARDVARTLVSAAPTLSRHLAKPQGVHSWLIFSVASGRFHQPQVASWSEVSDARDVPGRDRPLLLSAPLCRTCFSLSSRAHLEPHRGVFPRVASSGVETARPEKFVAYRRRRPERPPAGTIACRTNESGIMGRDQAWLKPAPRSVPPQQRSNLSQRFSLDGFR
jgi:hypothetical protein